MVYSLHRRLDSLCALESKEEKELENSGGKEIMNGLGGENSCLHFYNKLGITKKAPEMQAGTFTFR